MSSEEQMRRIYDGLTDALETLDPRCEFKTETVGALFGMALECAQSSGEHHEKHLRVMLHTLLRELAENGWPLSVQFEMPADTDRLSH